MDPKQPEQNKEMQNEDNEQQGQENMQEQQQVNQQEQQDNQQEGEVQIQGRVQEGDNDGGQGQDQQEQENQQEQRAQENQQKQVQHRQQMINQQIKEAPLQVVVPETVNQIKPQQNQALVQKKQKSNPVIQKQPIDAKLPAPKMNQEPKNTSQQKPVSNPQQQIIRTEIKHVETVPVVNSITQTQRQKYINSLENTLKQRQLNIRLLTSKSDQQSIKISALEQKNKDITQQFQQLNKNNKQIQTNYKIKQKLLQESVLKVQNLEKELVSYRQIGDIRILLRRVQELQGLVQAQKNQIAIIKSDGQQKNINESRQIPQRRYLAKQYIQKMQQLQNEKDELQSQIKQLNYKIQNKNQQNLQIHEIMNKMDTALKNNIERMSGMQEQLQKKQKLYQTEKHNLEQKIKILQKFIEIQTAKRTNNKILGEQQMQQQNNTNLQKERQKNILFRQFLNLELDHQTLEEVAKDYKTKYLQACKQLQKVKKQMVTKKDYEQVLLRYKKCKLCLQKSIKQNKMLRNNSTQNQMTQAQNQQTKNNIGLTQQQNTMKRYMEVLNEHMATAIDLSKQTNKITSDMHINRLKDQIKVKDKTIQELQEKNEKLQRWNHLFQNQLKYKNSLVDRLIEDGRNLTAQHNKVQKQRLALIGQLADNVTAKSSLNRLQSKSSALIIRNRKVINERDQWKSLYEQIKAKYQSFISRDPVQPQQQEKANKNIVESNEKMMEQGEIFQQKSQQRRPAKPKNLLTSQTQTQGLNQLYYKQIKETLSSLKKFPELIKKTTTEYQRVGKDLEQYKKKYDQVNLKYNMKFRELQNEKNENDLWRENAKKQLINEFQDIRDLVQNQRLIGCLRKAKSLIEYLEQGEEEEVQAVAQ